MSSLEIGALDGNRTHLRGLTLPVWKTGAYPVGH